MHINHNIRAMVTQHSLFSNNNAMGKSLEKLSTGLRINRAQDDAAGLAMSEQMRTQIRGLGKAKQNSLDGIAALQIAEGGMAEITGIMQRQRELAVQAANDTLTDTERKYLNDEFRELSQEIGRIAKTTDYNGKNMLNYSSDTNKSFGAVGAMTAETLWDMLFDDVVGKYYSMGSIFSNDPGFDTDKALELAEILNPIPPGYDSMTKDEAMKAIEERAKKTISLLAKMPDMFQSAEAKKAALELRDMLLGAYSYMGMDGLAVAYAKAVVSEHFDGKAPETASYVLQVGANYTNSLGGPSGNQMTITYMSVNPTYLGLSTRIISTQSGATDAIDQLDKVIRCISGARAKIGTFINRLEYTVSNISSLEFNTQDAESRIRDTDFAKETTSFTRNQIMVQAATSMLAQANALPQAVLGLVG